MGESNAHRITVTPVDDVRRRALAHRGAADLLWRRHCVVVSSDDTALLDMAVRVSRAGLLLRREVYPDAHRRSEIAVIPLDDAMRGRLAARTPRVHEGTGAIIVASQSREQLLTVLRMIRSGADMLAEADVPSTAVRPAMAVLTDAERRRLAVRHPELRRTRAAVIVTPFDPQPLAHTHVHPDAARRLAQDARPDVIAITPHVSELRALRVEHRVLSRHGSMLILAGPTLEGPVETARLLHAVSRFRARVSEMEEAQMPPRRQHPLVARVVQQRARLRDMGVLTAQEAGARAGSVQSNPGRLPQAWKTKGKVFAYRDQGVIVYPRFQFDTLGRPYPQVARIIAATPPHLRGGLSLATWFTTPNTNLDGRTPVDVMHTDIAAVERAVEQRSVTHHRQMRREATMVARRRQARGLG